MLTADFGMLGTGFQMLGADYSVLTTGFQMLDAKTAR